MQQCGFCAYIGDDPEFTKHTRAAHAWTADREPSAGGVAYGMAGPQLLAISFVLLFFLGLGWAMSGGYHLRDLFGAWW